MTDFVVNPPASSKKAETNTPPTYLLQTLGKPLLLDQSNNPVKLRSRKSLLLLACLATQPDQPFSREWLACTLWDGRPEEQARNSLRTALSDIRRVMGKNVILADLRSVSLNSSRVSSDIQQLQRFAKAKFSPNIGALSSFYGGGFLSGEDDLIAAPEWLASLRAMTQEAASHILATAVDQLAQNGNLDVAIKRARELLSLDTFSEKHHRRLMRLYAKSGERSKAISQFQSCRELLRLELAVDPSEETQQLADSIATKNKTEIAGLRAITAGLSFDHSRDVLRSISTKLGDNDSIRIAVLPFLNMTGDADQDYFVDGFAEDIIFDLTKFADLSVASASATRMYRATTLAPKQIAEELGVIYLLEGRVRKLGEVVSVSVNLVDGRTNNQIWGNRFSFELAKIFNVQTEISTCIVKAVQGKNSSFHSVPLSTGVTTNIEAHEHYLRGRSLLKQMTRKSVELSKSCFDKALEIDTGYALAFACRAESIIMLGSHYEVENSLLQSAFDDCQIALNINPNLAEAHCSAGRCHSLFSRTELAEASFYKAITLSPALPETHFYLGLMHMTLGRYADALTPLLDAFKLGSQDLQAGMMLMNCQLGLNLMQEQRETAYAVLNLAYRRIALNAYDDQATYVGGVALLALGQTEEALAWANVAASFDIADPRSTYNIACLFANLGKTKVALQFLKTTLVLGVPRVKLKWIREHDSDWNGIRNLVEFKEIVKI